MSQRKEKYRRQVLARCEQAADRAEALCQQAPNLERELRRQVNFRSSERRHRRSMERRCRGIALAAVVLALLSMILAAGAVATAVEAKRAAVVTVTAHPIPPVSGVVEVLAAGR